MVRIERNRVQEMFSDIAPTYDLLNRLLSLGVDRIWRRAAVRSLLDCLDGREGGRLLDLAAGTADAALEMRRRLRGRERVRVAGADIALPMLQRGREKVCGRGARICLLQADVLALPFPDDAFDGALIAFGLRNLADRPAGLAEMARVLRPGGRLVVLEFGRPEGLFGGMYRAYFRFVLPPVGRLVSRHPTAYNYLPASVYDFPDPEALSAMMRGAGFGAVRNEPMTGGIVQIHVGDR